MDNGRRRALVCQKRMGWALALSYPLYDTLESIPPPPHSTFFFFLFMYNSFLLIQFLFSQCTRPGHHAHHFTPHSFVGRYPVHESSLVRPFCVPPFILPPHICLVVHTARITPIFHSFADRNPPFPRSRWSSIEGAGMIALLVIMFPRSSLRLRYRRVR